MIKLNKIFMTLALVIVSIHAINAHTPGADYIYKCPKCSSFLKIGSNTSGNTFGSTIYSDGKMIAPMLPEFPNLTKCTKCDTILWLSDMTEIGTCDTWGEECKEEWKNADRADFLDAADLHRFLEMDTVKNDKERETFIRIQIWWAFNDLIRKGKELSNETSWKQNCRQLIKLLDTTDVEQKIMTAELHRNLGEFDACMKLINSLDNESFDWLIEKFKTECDNKNRFLIKLN